MIASGYLRTAYILRGIDNLPPTSNAMDDEFNDASFDTSKWTWLDQGGASASESGDRLALTLNENSNRIRGIYQSTPSGSWEVWAKIHNVIGIGNGGIHLFAAESTSGNVRSCAYWGGSTALLGLTYTSPSSTASAEGSSLSYPLSGVGPFSFYASIVWDDSAGQLHRLVSLDGRIWSTIATTTTGYTPALVGLGISNIANREAVYPFGWFRRIT
jgi:hypothetical protein